MTTKLERLTAERDRLREALKALYDAQSGPPLINRAAEWGNAMDLAAAALAAQREPERLPASGFTRQEAVERAYGLLWRDVGCSPHAYRARKILLELLDKDAQRRGIEYALQSVGPIQEHEIVHPGGVVRTGTLSPLRADQPADPAPTQKAATGGEPDIVAGAPCPNCGTNVEHPFPEAIDDLECPDCKWTYEPQGGDHG